MAKGSLVITGSHRSGSPWVGKMIAQSRIVGFVHEPFNLKCFLRFCNAQFSRGFTYISSKGYNLSAHQILQSILDFKYNLAAELQVCKTFKDYLRAIRDLVRTVQCRVTQVRLLMKDPLATFAAVWLAAQFEVDAVVFIRHPAAFASNFKVKAWAFPYQQTYLKWLYICHEDISLQPIVPFKVIFRYPNLEFLPAITQAIATATDASNPQRTSASIHFVKRNSELSIWNWLSRLSAKEIERIYRRMQDIAEVFYTLSDWDASQSVSEYAIQ